MDFSKVVTIKIPEGNVVKLQDSNGKVFYDINQYAYGIRFSDNISTCKRIGNLKLHSTLPVQSKFKVCVHQGTDIKYYCNNDDSRFRQNPTILQKDQFIFNSCDGLPDGVVCCDEDSNVQYKVTNNIFANYKYLYAYIYIKSSVAKSVARIVHIDVESKTAYLNDANQQDSDYATISGNIKFILDSNMAYTVELGTVINGYDGEIGVDTGGKFYQWSIDNGGTNDEVWMSEYKCVSYAKEVKRHIIGCNRACLLSTAFNDNRWGWIGTLNEYTIVNVINYDARLANNSLHSDKLGIDNFRCQLGKPVTNINLANARNYVQKLPNHQILYKQLWEAIVWAYSIEYANLSARVNYEKSLDKNGCRQGGLGISYGAGVIEYALYNNSNPYTPCDYTLHLGNNIGIRIRSPKNFKFVTLSDYRWNGYQFNDINYTIDNTYKILTITRITPSRINIRLPSASSVAGVHKYNIVGLTNNQIITFHTSNGNIEITKDGTYDIDWGHVKYNNRISFSIEQIECNITITIEKAPSSEIINTQKQWCVPHYRGFNVFWYGDVYIMLENFISVIDNEKKRTFYWTDDVSKFDNNIDNKEHNLKDKYASLVDCITRFNLGNQASLIPEKYGSVAATTSYNNSRNNFINFISYVCVGGATKNSSKVNISTFSTFNQINEAINDVGVVSCVIMD